MKDSLRPGLTTQFTFQVPENRTVPYLLPESPEFQVMPRVLATGFMVGLIEWACIQGVNPHLDWPEDQTVGIGVNVSHSAATPPGLSVTVHVRLEKVEGRKLIFAVSAEDDIDQISSGTHERFVIHAEPFNEKVLGKSDRLRRRRLGMG
jgi:fluoroacetyl-CoA thioesterase